MSLQSFNRCKISRIIKPALALCLTGALAIKSHAAPAAAAPIQGAPQKFALLVGINEYPNPNEKLRGCVNDARFADQELRFRGQKHRRLDR